MVHADAIIAGDIGDSKCDILLGDLRPEKSK